MTQRKPTKDVIVEVKKNKDNSWEPSVFNNPGIVKYIDWSKLEDLLRLSKALKTGESLHGARVDHEGITIYTSLV